MDRRKFLHTAAGAVASTAVATSVLATTACGATIGNTSPARMPAADVLDQHYPFVLPALGYAPNAVEPAVDAQTMTIHHDKHHAAYVTNLNTAIAAQPALHSKSLRELLTSLPSIPDAARNAVRNNGGGHANHAMFWQLLAPGGAKAPSGTLLTSITRDFGSVAALTAALKAGGLGQFGSGWVWLVQDKAGTPLKVRATANQDTPLSDGQHVVMGIDVWEHAYYLKYQNRRAEYLDAVLAAMNWDTVAKSIAA
jgi:Fe-Mn family superoxide dismutase